jgi:hypothetical protein
MFKTVQIPYESVMLFNIVKLKSGVDIDDVEMAMGEMCNIVKNNYSDENGGFIAGQVFKYSGFISDEGSIGNNDKESEHCVIITYWKSFEHHERSHKDHEFRKKFDTLADFCDETKELGYELLWQGNSELKI